jgi:hypothetical protein
VSGRTASCPNCGAPVAFRWSAAVQTTCDYCRSILVRHDLDLARVGTVADLPPDASPVQRGTTGRWRGRAFEVVGRIRYRHGRGRWSEWHLRFADGEGGWLSDAQLEWAITVPAPLPAGLPDVRGLLPGRVVTVGDERFTVTSVTRAAYEGVEGELPFTTWGRDEVPFVDLRTPTARFATLDGSEQPPLLFVGEVVAWDDLALANVRSFAGWPAP